MHYEDIINILKRNPPVSSEPDRLTKRILQSTRMREEIKIRSSWPVIYSARLVLTLAAAFLIVFFIYEQHQINTKLKKLENSIVQVRYPELLNNYQQVRYENQNLYHAIPYDSMKETLVINRQTLNFLMNRIRELETENRSIQNKLNALYNDSLIFYTPKP